IATQREKLLATVAEQAAEERRLSLLLEEKRRLQTQSEEMLVVEQARAGELAGEASSLRELIDALESEMEMMARSAAELAPDATIALPRTPNLSGSLPFSALAGKLELPA